MKTFIITTTVILTFLLGVFSIIPIRKTTPLRESLVVQTHNNCNTGYYMVKITWTPFTARHEKQRVRDSYIEYGKLPENLIINNNIEYWTIILDNMNPALIPPNRSCRTDLILTKIENDEEIEEAEEIPRPNN